MHPNTAGLNSPTFSNPELKVIFKRYYPELVYFASKIIHDRHNAEDIVSETFMKLSQKHPGDFPLEQTLKAFLYITTRNACLNVVLRKTKIEDDSQLALLPDSEEVYLDQTAIIAALLKEVNALPSELKQVILLGMEGKKQAEIAELMNLDVEKVKTYRRKALHLLRLKLLDKGIPLLYLYLLFSEN